MLPYIEEIEQHFKEWYPKEGCGVLALIEGDLKWFPCNNVAKGDDDFIIDSTQYIDITLKGDIVAVIHSHPDASCEPSPADIEACNTLGIPYYIFSYPKMEFYDLQPKTGEKPLYGRIYKFGVNDCFEAVRDYYIKRGVKNPPKRPLFEDDWWKKGLNYFTDEYIESWGFEKVTGTKQEGDLLVFTIQAEVPNHCGIYLGDDNFFHHAEHRLSCKENLFPFWGKYITGVYRRNET